jgi:hypothetical protein
MTLMHGYLIHAVLFLSINGRKTDLGCTLSSLMSPYACFAHHQGLRAFYGDEWFESVSYDAGFSGHSGEGDGLLEAGELVGS